jgi:predicted extracellular nuclease
MYICKTKNTIMKKFTFILLLSAFCLLPSAFSQPDSTRFCIAFYNVENLFDPAKDPQKNDGDFTPEGFYHWTYKRFYKKLNDIAKVFLTINEWEPPDVMGVAEIENANVLNKLCYTTGLKSYNYRYVHYSSPDARGIGVALLYRNDRITIINSYPISVTFPFEPTSKNRDILYAKALVPEDTLHLFVNHWTSRFSGYGATQPKRNYYAQVLRRHIDSLLTINSNACIVIMGDFNDYPNDESMSVYLQAKNYEKEAAQGVIFNLMFPFTAEKNRGSHKTQEFWGCLDQFIVSKSLLNNNSKWQIENRAAVIFDAPFLLEPDEKHGGVKCFRTYSGPKYVGGFSDHLPVKIVIVRD